MAEQPLPPITAQGLADQLKAAVGRHLDIVTSMQERSQQLKASQQPPSPVSGQAGALRRS